MNNNTKKEPFYKAVTEKRRRHNSRPHGKKNEIIEMIEDEEFEEVKEQKKAPANFPQCPNRKKCGGCQLQNLSYKEQLSFKMGSCIKLLGKYGHVEEIIGMKNPYHYRNKVQAAFYTDPRSRRIISGIYQSSTHHIVGMDSCMIEDKKADEIIVSVRKLLKDFKLTTYNEVTGKGFLRHVLVKRGFATNEIMVVLVTGTPVFTAKNNFCKALLKLHPEITTIIHNVNDKFTSMLLGQNEKVLYGPGYIVDECCGLRFRISAKSFYQINPVQTEKLYNKAMEFAKLRGGETVIDAYCGIGTIGMVAASRVQGKNPVKVIGVEVNADAVKDAKQNAQLNNMKNIRFYCADATEFLSNMAAEGEKADVVFMDPPRAGSTEEFILSVCTLAPSRVVYISCNPETLARDLKSFVNNGYKVTKIQPVDMFPHTQ
ncbi:MAG: 23S rRNA (uracil(1939)-C(5))-methyltransferase RlmD, partial [Clostridia bacterium]|nr:23S rRNA (uracil(1939)-C(5))-methyltransferase RlmD [Clostridia bacterium]